MMNLWLLQITCVHRGLNLQLTQKIDVQIVRIFAQNVILGILRRYLVELYRVDGLLKVLLIHLQLFCVFPGYERFALTIQQGVILDILKWLTGRSFLILW